MHRSSALRLSAGLVGLLVVLVAAPAALGKEGVSVELVAPISRDAKPGDVVPVVFRLTSISADGETPLRGSPVFIRLFSPSGARTEANGVEERTPGTYQAMIEIPSGGVARAEFGMHGTATDASGRVTPSDVTWAYDGILVAGEAPAAGNPGTFHAPAGAGVTGGEVAPIAATAPGASDPAAAAPSDGRLAGLAAAAGLIAVALVSAALRRRRWNSSPA